MEVISQFKFDKMLAFATDSPYLYAMPENPRKIPSLPITIVGLGAVGSALARAFRQKGLKDLTLIGRGRAGERRLANALKARYLTSLSDWDQTHGYIIFCIKEPQIRLLVNEIIGLKRNLSNSFVFHTSGVTASTILKPLVRYGASIAAWHPYQTFPRKSHSVCFNGVTFGISGQPKASRAGAKLARFLDGKPLMLRDRDRVLYHLSAVLACGFLTANLEMSVRVLRHIGIPENRARKIIQPIAEKTLINVKELGPRGALTGPAVRGDAKTIHAHLQTLAKIDPELAKVYASVSHYLVSHR